MAARLRSPDCTDDEKASLQSRMKKREELLSPLYHQVGKILYSLTVLTLIAILNLICFLYHQVAVHFADLHDTPARMVEKGVIRCGIKYLKKNSNSITYSNSLHRVL